MILLRALAALQRLYLRLRYREHRARCTPPSHAQERRHRKYRPWILAAVAAYVLARKIGGAR